MKKLSLLHLSKDIMNNFDLVKIKGGASCSPNGCSGLSDSVNKALSNMRENNPPTTTIKLGYTEDTYSMCSSDLDVL